MPRLPRLLRRRADNPEARMSVLDHLRELRRRLIIALLFVCAGAVVGWIIYDPVIHFLAHPYCAVPPKYRISTGGSDNCKLIYTGVLDGFTVRLKVSFIVGAIFSAPFWLYQIWGFLTPGLRKNEKKYTRYFVGASTLLFALGMFLAYVLLDHGLRAILSIGGDETAAFLTIDNYLGFVTLMLVVFGAGFELPLLVVMANFAGVLPARLLRRTQRIAIFLIFVFAAVATPTTDPFTMCAMAFPMVLLYEGAVLIAIVHDHRKAQRRLAARGAADASGAAPLDDDQPSAVDPLPRPLPSDPDDPDGWSDIT